MKCLPFEAVELIKSIYVFNRRVGAGFKNPLAACSITKKQIKRKPDSISSLRKEAVEHQKYVNGATMYLVEHNPGHSQLSHAYRDSLLPEKQFSGSHYAHQVKKIQAFKESFAQRQSISQSQVSKAQGSSRVYHVTSYGADPSGKNDSTNEILNAISDAARDPGNGILYKDIVNLGGVRIDLDGGNYKINRPLKLPVAGRGNLMIHGGTLTASEDFPTDGYLIDLSDSSSSGLEYNYEYVTLKDLLLDSNFRGSGGIQVIKSLRTGIDNCYITHFTGYGIFVQGGHETYIRNSFLGQHITAGGDPGERSFSGTAISLNGNDNAVTDVVIFSAATGILLSGPANTISGVHCYNKATGFGGTGIYLKLPGLTQTRIINSYFDYTGIVAEDPVQLHISSSFFLGDAFILLKSINGVARGVNIVDNMFSGSGKGVDIVQLDEQNKKFNDIDQVVVDRNNGRGMNVKATVAIGTTNGNDTSWTVDLNQALLFPDRVKSVHYSLIAGGDTFPNHALRNVTDNRIVVQSNVPVRATITVIVDQAIQMYYSLPDLFIFTVDDSHSYPTKSKLSFTCWELGPLI
ncbi:Polygalacturonase QRT3 [Heracleum sosnowskyi]|uniref:Polygalacturonase QRT3 n=1 Tax=Heracleum sosnowskyi TaxID=360622 RepID=A0AAD8IGV9_9APIA|nr:Polygalacturonase QRT3 [Heracleum sosnowskyi]